MKLLWKKHTHNQLLESKIDISLPWVSKESICDRYWFSRLSEFENWCAKFERRNARNNCDKYWIIRCDWTIILDDVCFCSMLSKRFIRFKKEVDWVYWFMNNEWKLIAEGFDDFWDFQKWYWDYAYFKKDWKEWKISSDLQNWFLIFRRQKPFDRTSEWQWWWMDQKCNILKEWFATTHSFNEEINGFASYILNWKKWYINTKWETFDEVIRNWKTYLYSKQREKYYLKDFLNKRNIKI